MHSIKFDMTYVSQENSRQVVQNPDLIGEHLILI